jgi:membrane-associated phospholipid phosphatase
MPFSDASAPLPVMPAPFDMGSVSGAALHSDPLESTMEGLPASHSTAHPKSLLYSAVLQMAPHEIVVLFFAVVFIIVALAGSSRVTEWPAVLFRMTAVIAMIFAVNAWSRLRPGQLSLLVKLFYVIVLPPIFFKAAEFIAFPLHGHDFDSMLILVDRMLCFGANPTVWLYQHIPIVPAFVEYLQICYSLFYFLPLALAVELYRNRSENDSLQTVFFVVLYGFLISYVSYFFFPSVGPRFTLHDFTLTSKELPGIFATNWLRDFLNLGENIKPGMPLAESLRVVTRDAFPSGHSEVTILTVILAFKFRARLRWPLAIVGGSLVFSTVYLRYHYVIDVLAGALLAMFVLYSWEWLRDRMISLRTGLLRIL